MATGTCVGHNLERDRLVDHRTPGSRHRSAAEEIEAGFVVNQRCESHAGIVDVGHEWFSAPVGPSLDAQEYRRTSRTARCALVKKGVPVATGASGLARLSVS